MNPRYSDNLLKKCGLLAPVKGGTKKVFTEVTTSQFNIDQIANERPDFWEKKGGEHFQRLKLVITDWSYQYLNTNLDKNHLIQLFRQKFEIYIWTGKLVKIENEIQLCSCLEKIEPIHADEINGIGARDTIKIIDYVENRKLISLFNNKTPQTDTLINMASLKNVAERKIEALINSLPRHHSYLADIFLQNGNENESRIINLAERFILALNIKNIHFHYRYFSKIDQIFFTDFFQRYGASITSLTCESSSIPYALLTPLTGLNEISLISIDNIKFDTFIKTVENIEKITIFSCKELSEIKSEIQFHNLQEIRISFCKKAQGFLQSLRVRSPKLMKLEVARLKGPIVDTLTYQGQKNDNIKELEIGDVEINSGDFLNYLQTLSFLESLRLRRVILVGEGSNFDKRQLKHLREVSITNEDIDSELLNYLLIYSPCLEKISLNGDIPAVEYDNLAKCPSLKKIRISDQEQQDPNKLINHILKSNKNLNELKVKHKYSYYEEFSYIKNDSVVMHKLDCNEDMFQYFDIHTKNFEINLTQLQVLMKSDFPKKHIISITVTSELPPLMIKECLEIFTGLQELASPNFLANQQIMRMYNETIDSETLCTLIDKFSSISTLDIQKTKINGKSPGIASKFNELIRLSVADSVIDSKLINTLIKASPNLCFLDLRGNDFDEFDLEDHNLKHTRYLILQKNKKFTTSHLLKFINSTKILEALHFTLTNNTFNNKTLNQIEFPETLNELKFEEESENNHDHGDIEDNNVVIDPKLLILNKLEKHFPSMSRIMIKNVLDYQRNNRLITDSNDADLSELFNNSPDMKRIQMHFSKWSPVRYFEKNQYQEIEELSIHTDASLDDIATIFEKAPAKIFHMQSKNGHVTHKNMELDISYSDSNLEADTIARFIQQCKILKSVNIAGRISGKLPFENFSSSIIESLRFSDLQSSINIIPPLLKSGRSPFILKSSGFTLDKDYNKVDGIQLNYTSKDTSLLPLLITTLPDISTIKVHKASYCQPSELENVSAFNNLRNAYFCCDMTEEYAQAFFRKCPNLKEFMVRNYENHAPNALLVYVDYKVELRNINFSRTLRLAFDISDRNKVKAYDFYSCNPSKGWPGNCIKQEQIYSASFNKCNVKLDFINELAAKQPSEIKIENCPYISYHMLKKLILDWPDTSFTYLDNDASKVLHERHHQSHSPLQPSSKVGDLIDADTESNNDSIQSKVHPYFQAKKDGFPYPNYFRIEVETNQDAVIEPIDNFKVSENVEEVYKSKYENNKHVFLGNHGIKTKKNLWYPLPSLSPTEKIIALETKADIRLGYSKTDDRYYVSTRKSGEYQFQFILEAKIDIDYRPHNHCDKPQDQKYLQCLQSYNPIQPNPSHFNLFKSLSTNERIDILIEYSRGFKIEKLQGEYRSKDEILAGLIRERKGVCRHATAVFSTFAKAFEIKHRTIGNQLHAFVEIYKDNQWKMICLGGAPSNTNDLNISPKPETTNKSAKTKKMLPLLNPVKKPDDKHIAKTPVQTKVFESRVSISKKPFTYQYANTFITWNKSKISLADNFTDLCRAIMKISSDLPPGSKNILLSFASTVQIEQFLNCLAAFTNDNDNQYHYVSSFSDLNTKEMIIDNEKGSYHICQSEILRSLNKVNFGDVLVYNITHYGKEDVLDSNSLTDSKNRSLRNTPLDSGLTVIAVKLKSTELGTDVHSRFSMQYDCSDIATPTETLKEMLAVRELPSAFNLNHVIDFYNGDNWQEQLCGIPSIHGGHYSYKTGAIVRMLENKESALAFYNPPNDLSEFRIFIQTLIQRKKIYINGIWHHLPENFTIYSLNKLYDFSTYHFELVKVIDEHSKQRWSHELNETNWNHFFASYECRDKLVFKKPGWIKAHQDKVMEIYVTDSFDKASWAKLLDEAKGRCKLKFIFANSDCPEFLLSPDECFSHQEMNTHLTDAIDIPSCTDEKNIHPDYSNSLILSNDCDFTELVLLKQKSHNSMVISIDENTSYADLVETISIDHQNNQHTFHLHTGCLRDALIHKQTVILKGQVGKELANKLQTLFSHEPHLYVNGRKEFYPDAQLIILTEENKYLAAANAIKYQHTQKEIFAELSLHFDIEHFSSFLVIHYKFIFDAKNEGITLTFSYDQLKRMLQIPKDCNPFLPMLRMHEKYELLARLSNQYYPDKGLMLSSKQDLRNHRLNLVKHTLSNSPYVFIVGNSGVGKSSFVLKEFAGSNLYVGHEKMIEWAENGGILFLDEANLDMDGNLNFIEGMFNSTPSILINKKLYPLTTHKVILAGNPNHYANRSTQYLLRHGAIVQFDEFPVWYLQKEIIEPALDKVASSFLAKNLSKDDLTQAQIIECFLNTYQFINQQKPRFSLTPRNLENMVLRFAQSISAGMSITDSIWLAAHDEVENISEQPLSDNFRKWINSQFPIDTLVKELNSRINLPNSSFILTESRKQILRIMKNQIEILSLKKGNPELASIGGVQGILLEGNPGIGKSQLAIEFLKSIGYQDASKGIIDIELPHYYYFSPDADIEEIKTFLNNAFHEGAIVVIDEFSSFDLEEYLNAFMSGVDLSGNHTDIPGFFLIATQNPISFRGRKELSAAQENRNHHMMMSDYLSSELQEIAITNKLNPRYSNVLADEFIDAVSVGRQHHIPDTPTFRAFERKIQELISNNPMSILPNIFFKLLNDYLDNKGKASLALSSRFFAPVIKPVFEIQHTEQVEKIIANETPERNEIEPVNTISPYHIAPVIEEQIEEQKPDLPEENSSSETQGLISGAEEIVISNKPQFFQRNPFILHLGIGLLMGAVAIGLSVLAVYTLGLAIPALGISLATFTTFGVGGLSAMTASILAGFSAAALFFGSKCCQKEENSENENQASVMPIQSRSHLSSPTTRKTISLPKAKHNHTIFGKNTEPGRSEQDHQIPSERSSSESISLTASYQ